MTDEKKLIEQIITGNTPAFQTLIEEYQRLVSHIVFRMVTNDSDREDVCQDVFIKVYQNLANFHFESKLSTWIARIAYNTSINYLKKKKLPLYDDFSPENQSIEDYKGDNNSPDAFTEEKDLSSRLHNEISKLPAQYRTILTLYHLDEMSYAEIAEITQYPDGTVKSYLFRARTILKERLTSKYQLEELWH